MAVVTVTFEGVRLSGAENPDDGGVWDKFGASQDPSSEEDFILQGAFEMSNKISTNQGGVEFIPTSSVDFETTPKALIPKILLTTTGLIRFIADGMSYYIGSDGQGGDAANFFRYDLFGIKANYPVDRSWLSPVIDPNIAGYRDIDDGTVVVTAMDYFGLYVDTDDSSKSENIVHSGLDYVDIGSGLLLVGGDGGDPDGVFLDFVIEDEDSVDGNGFFDNRWRMASRVYGSDKVIAAIATWKIGSATATVFTDLTSQTIAWPGGRVGTGMHGLEIGLQNTANVIQISSKVFVSDGSSAKVRFFDTALEVDVAAQPRIDMVTIPGHGFVTGDYVLYTDEGGADTIGLTDATSYWVGVVDANSLTFFTTQSNAHAHETYTIADTFNTGTGVDGSTEVITTATHNLITGQRVLYDLGAGVQNVGLTDQTFYFINALSSTTLAIYTNKADALADTNRIDLTSGGAETHTLFNAVLPEGLTTQAAPGENHKLDKVDDSRCHLTANGTTATVAATINSCTFDNFEKYTLTSKLTMTSTKFTTGSLLTLASGKLTSCTIDSADLEEGGHFIDTADLGSDLSACTFIAGSEGHGVRMTTAPGPSENWDHTLTGYWAPADLGWEFSTAQSFASEQIDMDANHGFTSGDAVYYNDEGGVETIGLTDGVKYYVNVVDANTVTVHLTRASGTDGSSPIDLTTSGSETQSLYSSKAALFNDTSSGTLTIAVASGDAPSVRNAPGATTVVNADVAVTFTNLKDNSEIRICAAGTNTPLAGIEDATDGSPDARTFLASIAAGTSVDYIIHNFQPGVVMYQTIRVESFSWPSAAQDIVVNQQIDRNVE